MRSAESPKQRSISASSSLQNHPPHHMTTLIIKLHVFIDALKREPRRFQNTLFLVDRLHYRRGHVGCSLGYSMDSYASDEYVSSINSQANEQWQPSWPPWHQTTWRNTRQCFWHSGTLIKLWPWKCREMDSLCYKLKKKFPSTSKESYLYVHWCTSVQPLDLQSMSYFMLKNALLLWMSKLQLQQ